MTASSRPRLAVVADVGVHAQLRPCSGRGMLERQGAADGAGGAGDEDRARCRHSNVSNGERSAASTRAAFSTAKAMPWAQ